MLRSATLFAFLCAYSLLATADVSQRGFLELSAKEKQDHLWQKLTKSQYGVLPELCSLRDRFLGRHKSSYCLLRENIGSTAKIEYVQLIGQNLGFTGIYQSGAVGFVALLLKSDSEAEMGLQILIDDSMSIGLRVNTPADVHGPKTNWFTESFSAETRLPSSIVENLLYRASPAEIPGHFVDNIAKRRRDGRLVFDMRAPLRIFLVPSKELKEAILADSLSDFRADLSDNLPENTTIYEVLAERAGFPEPLHIANIVTRSEFIASKFGDEVLFR